MRPRRWLPIVLGVGVAAGCGDDEAVTRPDAAPSPDAMPAPLCIDQSDTACGYQPEPVLLTDVTLVGQQTLADYFSPAAVYTGGNVWAVSVDYLLEHGGPLRQAEHDGRLDVSYRVDEATTANVYLDPQPDLTATDLSGLPTVAAGGRGLVYFLDAPGGNTGNDVTDETWSTEWLAIQGTEPTAAPYPPHMYAHLFWLSKADRLLAIQYFFFYPYAKFTSNHEGDWEHVNVVLRFPEAGVATLGMVQYSLHGAQVGVAAEELYRVRDDGNRGDHVVVFVGGEACQSFVPDCYCGNVSGASFPYPGRYPIVSTEEVGGFTDQVGRAIGPGDFTVELLPRIEDVDFTARPSLSWYALPFVFGDPTTEPNADAVIAGNGHRAPAGPGVLHAEYDHGIEEATAILASAGLRPFDPLPAGWTFVNQPPAAVFTELPPPSSCTPL